MFLDAEKRHFQPGHIFGKRGGKSSVRTVDTGFGTISLEVRGPAGHSSQKDFVGTPVSAPQNEEEEEPVYERAGLNEVTRDLRQMLDSWKSLIADEPGTRNFRFYVSKKNLGIFQF